MMGKQHTAVIKKCTGCGRYNTEQLGKNENGEPFLACCPDSNYKEVTAVDFLFSLLPYRIKEGFKEANVYEQAKQMERERIEKAYNIGEDSGCSSTQGTGQLFKDGKDYYTQTHGQ